jgi:hypothetical protein
MLPILRSNFATVFTVIIHSALLLWLGACSVENGESTLAEGSAEGSAVGSAVGSAKDLEGSSEKPLRIGTNQPPSKSQCAKINEQKRAEENSRLMIRQRCQAINEKLESLGQPHCERDLCFSSSRTPDSRKVEVGLSIWNATAYSQKPGFSLVLAIFFDSKDNAIFDCRDVSSPSFSMEELAEFNQYQDILEKRNLCNP